MAGSIVKGDLDVSRAVKTIRTNETLLSIVGTSNVVLTATNGKFVNSAATAAIDITLPAANVTPIQQGFAYFISNNGTGTITIKTNGGAVLDTIDSGLSALIYNLSIANAAGMWEFIHLDRDLSGITKTSIPFNGTTNWGTAASGEYSMTITAANSNGGSNPEFSIYETVTNGFDKIDGIDAFVSSAAGTVGNIIIKVNEVPDERFAGRIVVY